MNIAIIGSGSWGVALAVHLASVGNNVKIWSFMEEERDLINNERKCKFLPGVELPENIMCSTDFEEVIKNSKMILHVTPSKFTRSTFRQYKEYVGNKPVIICSKGFEKETSIRDKQFGDFTKNITELSLISKLKFVDFGK